MTSPVCVLHPPSVEFSSCLDLREESPSSDTSVTEWICQLQAGDSAAAHRLWHRYVERLVHLACRKLGELPRRVADEDDVVNAAFNEFLRGVQDERFARLNDRTDLWQILVMLTERKAINLRKKANAQKRGGGKVRGESALRENGAISSATDGIGRLPGREPTPEFAAQVRDEFRRLYALLADETLRQIARGKLVGHTNAELAARLKLSLRLWSGSCN